MRDVLVLSAAGPGECDGIGDYSWHLARAMNGTLMVRKPGGFASHLTDVGAGFSRPDETPIEYVSSWHDLEVPAWQERGRAADVVLVQYFPQAFVAPDFGALVRWLRLRREVARPVIVTLHEYWPHAGLSPRRAYRRWRSRRALRALVDVSTAMVVSQAYSVRELVASGIVPERALHIIPIGSAVPPVAATAEPAQSRSTPQAPSLKPQASSPQDRPILAMFGQPAMMNEAAVSAIARWLAGCAAPPRLWWFSRSQHELQSWWTRAVGADADVVTFHAGLPADALSRRLQQATLGLALYVDGASTRRSSLAALLQHTLPIVALDGRYTDDGLRRSGALRFVRGDDPEALPAAIAELLADPRRRAEMSAAAARFYADELSWPRIAARYRVLEAPMTR